MKLDNSITLGKYPKISNIIYHMFFFFCLNFAFYAVVYKILNGMANSVQTLIRLLLKEQYNLGLHCLHIPFVRNFGVGNFRTFTKHLNM